MMSTWDRIKAAFYEARELSDDERCRYLAHLDDGLIRSEVESLLEADRPQDEFLEPPRFGAVSATLGEVEPARFVMLPGSRIGPYEIDERIGSGGMGEVYRARRVDGAFDRHVALKVLKRGLDTEPLLERFARERAALGRLTHPNIAQLFDAGSLEDGRPYFVMELVDGQSIDRYCDDRRLTTVERVRLFVEALAAVECAHRNLVVHRDLKPSNILVSVDGSAKLLDFGIAKLLDDDSNQTVLPTQTPLTVEFASPEQVRGDAITTATDVYSMGTVLYRLLVGGGPFELENATRAEAERVVGSELPKSPSRWLEARSEVNREEVARQRSASVSSLQRDLVGDLDAIVSKALRKEPELRYAGVSALREDLERWCTGEPVAARAGSSTYRLRHWVRRHRPALIGGATLLLALMAGIVTTSVQAITAARERDRAVRAQVELERINDFLQSMLKSANPAREGRDVTVLEVIDKAAQGVDVELRDSPRIAATVHTTLGETYHSLGEYRPAAREFERALELRLEHESDEPERLAWSYNNMAFVHYNRGEFDDAVKLFRQAAELNRIAFGNEHPDLAQVLNNLASALHARRDLDAALAASREALGIRRRTLGDRSLEVAESLNNLANLYRSLDRLEAARAALEESVSIRRERLRLDHPLVLQSLVNLAVLEIGLGEDYETARRLLETALVGYRRQLGDDHPDLAFPLIHLGTIDRLQGDLPSAAERLARAAELRRDALPTGHRLIAYAEALHGLILVELGRVREGRVKIERHLAAVVEWLGPDHVRSRELRSALGTERVADSD